MIHPHDARTPEDTLRFILAEWRVGRKVGRTIYALVPDEPDGVLIGQFDSAQLARDAVHHHNLAIRGRRTS
ncbi:MAG: hypothetical protein LC798_19660 [Chloroflexi bacterium]|nr:hypothetical protein [Chloroflexota bacterium]